MDKVKKILVTGASGLIGSRLTELLVQSGYSVNVLSRSRKKTTTNATSFEWNIEKGELDENAFSGVSAIVHLAGAGIAEKRWTHERKKEILDSRIKSARMIYEFLKKRKYQAQTFVSPSGIDYYAESGDKWQTEESAPGKGFLADVCTKWEQEALEIGKFGIREVRLRTGIVLSNKGGALPELMKTIPFGFAGYFAKTPLYYSWIHIDDLCSIIIYAIENEKITGVHNAVAPNPVQLKDLMEEILVVRKSNALLLPVPPIALRLMLGEMSEMLLGSHRCSAEKIMAEGYQFKFGEIKEALRVLF